MNTSLATPHSFDEAFHTRLSQSNHLGDRRHYIGASEVGNCLRHVIASKLNPTERDMPSMGRMLAGRAMENEVVQLLRIAMGGRLRETGRSQREYIHPHLPFHAHPDGRIVGNEFDGVLEVKTASESAFKRYTSEGLPRHYVDQVQAQMGLSGLGFALVVLSSRENLADLESIPIAFDAERYAGLEERAAKATTFLKGDQGLPEGEPERGFCFNCPFAHECPQHQAAIRSVAEGVLPEVLRLQLECHLEELTTLTQQLDPLQQRESELRAQIKDTLQGLQASKVVLEGGTLQMVASSRTSLDAKAIQQTLPDVYKRFLKTSQFSTLRITAKGAKSCLSMVS